MPIRMTNATAIYTIMMLVFACGMWVVLVYGSTLEAPPDLAGQWELQPEGRGIHEPLKATIEQSGRYLRLRIGAHEYDLRMTVEGTRIRMKGDGAVAEFRPSPSPDVFRVTLTTPYHAQRRYSARIVERTHPRTPPGNKPQSTSLAPVSPATHAH